MYELQDCGTIASNLLMLHRAELKAREWRSRVIDEKFLPFSRRQYHHEPLLHTKTPFTRLVIKYLYTRIDFSLV